MDEGASETFLGNPSVVDALVRMTVFEILQMRAAATEKGEEVVTSAITDRIQRMVDILLGRSNNYEPMAAGFNSPTGQIVRSVAAAVGVDPESEAADAIMALPIALILSAISDAETLEMNGEDWEHIVDGEIDSAVRAYMGIAEIAV
jgi:hypothetical protein